MSEKQKLEPKIILTIYTKVLGYVHFIVTTKDYEILLLDKIEYNPLWQNNIDLRKQIRIKTNQIIEQYSVDTILLEDTKLFTDGITKYPDPEIYKNIVYCFGIKITIEDNFIDKVDNILIIPYKDWTETVLNTKLKYLLDRCKNHILGYNQFTDEQGELIKQCNFYQALCFSESIKYDKLINKKYKVK